MIFGLFKTMYFFILHFEVRNLGSKGTIVKEEPSVKVMPLLGISPTRIFGPCKSCKVISKKKFPTHSQNLFVEHLK